MILNNVEPIFRRGIWKSCQFSAFSSSISGRHLYCGPVPLSLGVLSVFPDFPFSPKLSVLRSHFRLLSFLQSLNRSFFLWLDSWPISSSSQSHPFLADELQMFRQHFFLYFSVHYPVMHYRDIYESQGLARGALNLEVANETLFRLAPPAVPVQNTPTCKTETPKLSLFLLPQLLPPINAHVPFLLTLILSQFSLPHYTHCHYFSLAPLRLFFEIH